MKACNYMNAKIPIQNLILISYRNFLTRNNKIKVFHELKKYKSLNPFTNDFNKYVQEFHKCIIK